MLKNGFHKLIFAIILIVLFLPLVQKELPFFASKPLQGSVTKSAKPIFSWRSWWNGDFQQQREAYVKDNIGGHSDLVRIHNELDYRLFGEVHAKGVVVGKEGYLYEKGYIDAYLGTTFVGEAKVNQQINKLVALQDTLAKLDKTLLVVFAAGKASYFPDYFPERMDTIEKQISTYEFYRQRVAETGIQYIDFNQWFLAMKDTISHPLFPKTGIHWGSYGEYLVADSLIRYMERVREIDLPEIVSDGITWHHPPIGRDRDIEAGMNLITSFDTYAMPKPSIRYETTGKERIKGLVVADSYYWGLEHIYFTQNVFEEGHFWFYNNSVYPSSCGINSVSELNLSEEINKRDIIILLATEATIGNFAWGFIHNLYEEWFEPEKKAARIRKEKINKNINLIKADKKWFQHVQEKAMKRNIGVDSMLYLDAVYWLDETK